MRGPRQEAARTAAPETPAPSRVLGKAVVRAADLLGLTQKELSRILGVSEATASRLRSDKYRLSPDRAKEWELARLFVRLFRSLDALWGHEGTARAWLETYNTALGAAPRELIKSAVGLVRVVDYLDHARGRV